MEPTQKLKIIDFTEPVERSAHSPLPLMNTPLTLNSLNITHRNEAH